MSPSTIPFLLHLAPLSPSEIPAHPSIPYSSPSSASDGAIDARPSLSLFLHAALTQARDFIATTVPGESFTTDRKLYDSPPSSTPVQISSGTVKYTPLASKNPATPQKEDKWFARRTVLDNRTTMGNASFQEFVEGLKDSHLMNEMEYEPNITAVEDIAKWDCSGVEVEGGWSGVGASLSLVTHTFQPASVISPRVFLAMVITAFTPPEPPTSTTPSAFINIQLPIHVSAIRPALPLPKNAVLGKYVSVEMVRVLADADDAAGPGKIEWRMATSSQAGGWIPRFLQHSSIPNAIAKDVGLFLKWVDERRAKKAGR
ncbi:conserved hypothetical protein [Histoplasma capsulatum var. duboisii H88]|uniref:SRPBCC superfamily domain-containing protein, DUF3074 domain n=2 Tax=Ajellomyces capsulatus TaxID=5037 RepID=F0UBV4_AJEC8|nr:conserved hypothetical protein [Histoplasma capsulatum H143]EGC43953.1 conserved hypothetical protein [Histoplasma capsulatum var. duboisii H88]QSS50118.1 SRPBCC superfamily domain-containing protein, DUF3074 domain [Histoplasma capsulatum var. duboisii H88]